jgi:hypothetical protein
MMARALLQSFAGGGPALQTSAHGEEMVFDTRKPNLGGYNVGLQEDRKVAGRKGTRTRRKRPEGTGVRQESTLNVLRDGCGHDKEYEGCTQGNKAFPRH